MVKWLLRGVATIAVLFVGAIIVSVMQGPNEDFAFRAEMAARDGVPFEYPAIAEFHKLSLTDQEKTCLDRYVRNFDSDYKNGLAQELERQAYNLKMSFPDYRRRFISWQAGKKCAGLGRKV
jgi:hypothetical protein